MSKKELIQEMDNAEGHIENVYKVIEIVVQRFRAQQGSGERHSSFGFGVGRNWLEAGLMTAGMHLLTGAASSGINNLKKNKKTKEVAGKIETLAYDSYYDKYAKNGVAPEDVTSDNLMEIAKDVCWAIGI